MRCHAAVRGWCGRFLALGAVMLTAMALDAAVGPPPAAAAEYGLPQLISRPSATQQPNGPAQQVAASANGRYILYRLDATNMAAPGLPPGPGGLPGAGGIYRYDTWTGTSELAAYGYFSSYAGGTGMYGAENASISADGRYVLFDSFGLLPGDTVPSSEPTHVYIRDMALPVDQRSSYATPIGLSRNATAVGPHGFSNDGTRLLWTSHDQSDSGVTYWTDLSTGVTRPVSVAYDLSSDTMNPSQPLRDTQNNFAGLDGLPIENAVLSGDGTTVAWVADDVTKATPSAPGESSASGVLCRRIADGDRARTRRVTSAADTESPACTPATPVTTDPTPPGPCDNPQLDSAGTSVNGLVIAQPAGTVAGLSDDGQKVAVLSQGHVRGSGIPHTTDAYVVTMFPGQDPARSIQPLTRALPGDPLSVSPEADAPILGATISGDGRYVAFVTQRVLFPLSPPTQVGSFSTYVGANELYIVDLQSQRVQLLSQTPSGAKQDTGTSPGLQQGNPSPGPGVTLPALSEDGATVAFMSSADNLAPADANGFTDAFVVQRLPASSGSDQTGPQVEQLPPTAPDVSPQPDWSLLVDGVTPHPDGTATLTVETPAAGVVSATVADGGRALAAADSAAIGPATVTLTLVPHVTGAEGDPGFRRTRWATAQLRFTPAAGGYGPVLTSVPVTFTLPAATIGVRTHALRTRRGLSLHLALPAAGRVTVVATRRMRRGHRAITATIATATGRARRTGRLDVMLTPSVAARRTLPLEPTRVDVVIRFTPASAGPVPRLTRTLTVTLPAQGGR
jgi:hypothetical protein